LIGAFFPGSLFIRLAVWVIMMKYAYAALTTTAQGALTAPKVTWELINQDVLQVFKQFAVFGIIGFIGSFIFGFSIIAGFLFIIIIVACIPSIIMVLVSSNSIFQAINPSSVYTNNTKNRLAVFADVSVFIFSVRSTCRAILLSSS
jgi:hypothetical protein